MNLQRTNRKIRFRRLAGWCGLWFYVGLGSPLGLGLATLMGSLDPDHQLQFHAGPHTFQMVMHHGPNCARHHHGVVARALTAFASPAASHDPDHVLQFTGGENLKSESTTSAPLPEHVVGDFMQLWNGSPVLGLAAFESGCSIHPPPDQAVTQLCQRSIVLLI